MNTSWISAFMFRLRARSSSVDRSSFDSNVPLRSVERSESKGSTRTDPPTRLVSAQFVVAGVFSVRARDLRLGAATDPTIAAINDLHGNLSLPPRA